MKTRNLIAWFFVVPCLLALILCENSFAEVPKMSSVTLGNSSLPVSLERQARCMFGDLDAMKLEIVHSGSETKMLLSVESLLHPAGKGFSSSAEITRENINELTLKEKKLVKLPLPVSSNDKLDLVGVFICKESTGKNYCSGKTVEDVNEMLKRYDPDKKGYDRNQIASDKIYYFKPALVKNGELFFIKERMNDDLYSFFDEKIKSTLGEGRLVLNALKKARLISATLLSAPLSRLSSSSIGIILPEVDAQKCGG